MIQVFERLMRRLGVKVSSFLVSPYEHLLDAPRYVEMTVDLNGCEFRIADARSFYNSYREIFYDRIYEFRTDVKSPVILDCGSNYGTSLVFFKMLYPDSVITAVEPDPEIFKLLQWNVAKRSFTNVSLVNKAISSTRGPVRFYREGSDSGRVVPSSDCIEVVNADCVALDDLITGPVDLLKMDIEGSESEAICASRKLGDVARLFVEYHSFVNVPQTLGDILAKLASSGFRYYIHKQSCPSRPFTESRVRHGMDMQLNIFAMREQHRS